MIERGEKMTEMTADITVLLDRTGSMGTIRDDTIGGFNTFLTDQKALPGKAYFSLVQFDSEGFDKLATAELLADVKPLTRETFVPRAATPLLDAIGRTITETGMRLSKEPARRVVFVIITDGHENASKEYTRAKVFDMIKTQRDEWRWQFLFLGANQDAIGTGMGMGFQAGQAMTYAATSSGVRKAYAVATSSVGRARAGGKTDLTDEERKRGKAN